MTTAPPATRRVEPNGDSWDWFLPSSGTLPGRDGSPVTAPAQGTGESVAFASASPYEGGYEVYRSVRGNVTVADILRVPFALPAAAEEGLPHVVHRAVAGSPEADDATPDPSPPLWEEVHAFLEESASTGIEGAARVLSLLGDTPPDPAFLRHSSQRTLGLGRIVLGMDQDSGEVRFDTATVLVPSAPAPFVMNLSRTLAEILLTARLFATADKASAPSLSRVAASYSVLAARHTPLSVATLRAGAAVLVVDHARRLASLKGVDPPTVALELSAAAALLSRGEPGTHPA